MNNCSDDKKKLCLANEVEAKIKINHTKNLKYNEILSLRSDQGNVNLSQHFAEKIMKTE